MQKIAIVVLSLIFMQAAAAQQDTFREGKDGAKLHVASGFICPVKIGRFERNAVGVRSTVAKTDYCAYSARDGVYGSIILRPLPREYRPKAMLARDFVVMEGVGSRQVGESSEKLGPDKSITAFLRSYETARIEALQYRVDYVLAPVGSWAVQVTMEYAKPRDVSARDAFLKAAYDMAAKELAAQN